MLITLVNQRWTTEILIKTQQSVYLHQSITDMILIFIFQFLILSQSRLIQWLSLTFFSRSCISVVKPLAYNRCADCTLYIIQRWQEKVNIGFVFFLRMCFTFTHETNTLHYITLQQTNKNICMYLGISCLIFACIQIFKIVSAKFVAKELTIWPNEGIWPNEQMTCAILN